MLGKQPVEYSGKTNVVYIIGKMGNMMQITHDGDVHLLLE